MGEFARLCLAVQKDGQGDPIQNHDGHEICNHFLHFRSSYLNIEYPYRKT